MFWSFFKVAFYWGVALDYESGKPVFRASWLSFVYLFPYFIPKLITGTLQG